MKLSIHPSAAIFPMMADDELQVLAEDIKANGLVHPIVVRKNGKGDEVIDGRNRLRACEIASVLPTFETFTGYDDAANAFILSNNINRRHMTASQRDGDGDGQAERETWP